MKASDAQRAAMLVSAQKEWAELLKACRKRGDLRGLEFLVGALRIDDGHTYVENHDASVTIDCKTGELICNAAFNIITLELRKLGIRD